MANLTDFEGFHLTEAAIKEALQITKNKLPHICPKAPDGSLRHAERISTNIFHGALAQIAVEEVLVRYGASDVEIYDRIRSDDFRNPDLFDIKASFSGKSRTIEVRSSYLTLKCAGGSGGLEKLNCIRNSYNLITEYQTSYKPGEAKKEFFFQVYWLYTQGEAMKFFHVCVDSLPSNLGACFVIGFATQKLFKAVGRVSALGQRGASFKLVPITAAYPCSKLLELSK